MGTAVYESGGAHYSTGRTVSKRLGAPIRERCTRLRNAGVHGMRDLAKCNARHITKVCCVGRRMKLVQPLYSEYYH